MEKREQARKLWEQGKSLKDIAAELGVPYATVKSWKQRDAWGKDARMRTDASKQKDASRKKEQRAILQIAKHVESNDALEEWEKDFCLHFVQCFNRTTAALRTGHWTTYASAKKNGNETYHKPAVQAEIKRLLEIQRSAIVADTKDLVELHMRIAFASMEDYVQWGFVQGRGNCMAVKPSEMVDAQLIGEVSESAQGFKIKLRDQKASMEFLERYFLANPMDKHKVAYDNAKLELERKKTESGQPTYGKLEELIEGLKQHE